MSANPFVTSFPDGEFVIFRKEQDGNYFSKEALEQLSNTLLEYLMNCMLNHGELSGTAPSRMFVKMGATFDSGLGMPEGFGDPGTMAS